MKTDSELKRDVESELKWDPDIDTTDVGVAVKDGVVTLTGFVRSWSQKPCVVDRSLRTHSQRLLARVCIQVTCARQTPRVRRAFGERS